MRGGDGVSKLAPAILALRAGDPIIFQEFSGIRVGAVEEVDSGLPCSTGFETKASFSSTLATIIR